MQFYDSAELDLTDAQVTRDGYLPVIARIARTGIYTYSGAEVGKPNMAAARVYRSDTEVFSGDALASFAHKAVTNDHPPAMVDARSWRKYAVGFSGDHVARDGGYIRLPMMLADAAAIADVRAGKREISAGYTCKLDWTPGKTLDGETYDAVMTDIRANHLAIVDKGRAGSECRIGDHNRQEPDMPDALRAVLVDGISIQTTDQGAQALERVQSQLRDALAATTAANAATEALRGQHDAAVSAKDAEIVALKARIPDAAAMDAAIRSRLTVIDAARKLLGTAFDATGKSDADIRRAVVSDKLGALATGKSDEYVAAAFDTLSVGAVAVDPLRAALATGVVANDADPRVTAHAEMVDRMRSGWKGAK